MDLRTLAQPSSRFAGDHGEADPLTREALARVEDPTSYIRALVALCSSRLLLPIVASGDDGGTEPDPDRQAEMAAVTLTDESGSHLLAFTGVDSLQVWQASARPVPCLLDELCATVKAAGAEQLLIDVAEEMHKAGRLPDRQQWVADCQQRKGMDKLVMYPFFKNAQLVFREFGF